MTAGRRQTVGPFDAALAIVGATLGLASALVSDVKEGSGVAQWLAVGAWACVALVGVRLTTWLIVDVALRRRGLRPSSLMRGAVAATLYAVALITIVRFGLDRDVTTLLTGSAILTAVAGFALQATLGNLFGGLALQAEQPFGIGHIVRIGDAVGRIEAMTWRAVHLRTEEQSLVVVPNSVVGEEAVEVVGGDELVERTVEVDAHPAAPPGRVVALLERLVAGIPGVASHPAPEVYPVGLREWLGSRVYEVQYFPVEYLDFERIEAEIRRRAWYRLVRHELGASAMVDQSGAGGPPGRAPDGGELVRRLSEDPLLAALAGPDPGALVDRAKVLLYTEDDPIGDLPDPGPALFLVVAGRISARLPGTPAGQTLALRPLDANVEAWSPEELVRVESLLIEHVGPVAEFLVPRAAALTADPGRLRRILAQEIPDPEGRARFLAGAPQIPTKEIGVGGLFGVDGVFGDGNPRLGRYIASSEGALLRLPKSTVYAALAAHPDRIEPTLAAIERWRSTHPNEMSAGLPAVQELRTQLSG